eukprot:8622110-Ditylum_brightwellii.AAC.1
MACDNAMYSDSVVISDISECSCEDHTSGQLVYLIMYLVLDNADVGSSLQHLLQFPANDASTYTSKSLFLP